MNPKLSKHMARLKGLAIAVAGFSLLATQAGAEVTPGYDLYIDARQDTDGDLQAEDLTVGNPSGLELLLDDDPLVSRVATTTSTQLTEAYDLPGGSINNEAGLLLVQTGTSDQRSFQEAAGPGDWSNKPVSLEIWFKPDNLTPTPSNGQILFEDGGGTGLGLFIRNNELLLSNDSGDGQISYNLATDPSGILLGAATTEFIHVVATHNAGAGNECQLFVNGTLIGSSVDDGDWSGGDAAGFGTRGDANVGGYGGGQQNTETFDGQIALVRAYQGQILTLTEVQANFDEDKLGIPNQTKIVLAGDNPITIERATSYTDPGVTEVLDVDQGTALPGAETEVTIDTSGLDVNTSGFYTVEFSYDAIDPLLDTTAKRTVIVVDTEAPVVQLIGAASITIPAGAPFIDPGATATDVNDDSATPVYSSANAPIPSAATGKWTFDDDTINDSSGNGYDGIPVGTMIYSTDTPYDSGKSIDFSGGDNAFYVDDDTVNQSTFEPTPFMRAPAPGDPTVLNQWSIDSSGPNGTVGVSTTDFVETNDEIDTAIGNDPSLAGTLWDNVNFGDGANGKNSGDNLYPGAVDNNPENIAIRATNTLVIPSDGFYVIGFQSDDGSSLLIENTNGNHFETPLLETNTGVSVIRVASEVVNPSLANTGSTGPDSEFGLPEFVASTDPLLTGGNAPTLPDLEQAGALLGDADTSITLLPGAAKFEVPFDPALNPANGAGEALPYTVEAWIKPNVSDGGNQAVVNSMMAGINHNPDNANDRSGYSLRLSGDEYQFYVGGINGGTFYEIARAPAAVVVDQWQHVVGIYDGANVKIYVNGVLAQSVVAAEHVPLLANSAAPIIIGDRGFGGWAFNGGVDEVAVYDSILSDATILEHYNNGVDAARVTPYPTLVAASTPTGYWRCGDAATPPPTIDDVTGLFGPANGGDVRGAGRIFLEAGNYPISFISRERGGGEHTEVFARADSSTKYDPLTFGGFAGYPADSPLTISLFAKRNGWNGNWSAMATKRGEGGQGWQVRRRGAEDKVVFTTRGLGNDDPTQGSITSVPNGQWHHIVAEYGGSGGNRKLWIDGVLDYDITSIGLLNPAPGFNFAVGALDNDAASGPNLTNYFQGMIDNVCVFHRTLSDQERFGLLAGGGNLDTNTPGTYTINYVSLDPSGNAGIATREVVVGPAVPFTITAVELQDDGSLDLTWNSLPGAFYTVSVSTDLETWLDAVSGFDSQGEVSIFNYTGGVDLPDPDPAVNPRLFFRVTKE